MKGIFPFGKRRKFGKLKPDYGMQMIIYNKLRRNEQ